MGCGFLGGFVAGRFVLFGGFWFVLVLCAGYRFVGFLGVWDLGYFGAIVVCIDVGAGRVNALFCWILAGGGFGRLVGLLVLI